MKNILQKLYYYSPFIPFLGIFVLMLEITTKNYKESVIKYNDKITLNVFLIIQTISFMLFTILGIIYLPLLFIYLTKCL